MTKKDPVAREKNAMRNTQLKKNKKIGPSFTPFNKRTSWRLTLYIYV